MKRNNKKIQRGKASLTIIHKRLGETPLEALNRYRLKHNLGNVPMTYAGRLDPLASGKLLILWGDECKNKEKYLGLDKEYEIRVLFGLSTDTYDLLGLVNSVSDRENLKNNERGIIDLIKKFSNNCPQKVHQTYPPYSSKTVEGIPLFELARKNLLPDEIPKKEVEIYSCKIISRGNICASVLLKNIKRDIAKVKGDFRQAEILKKWQEILSGPASFPVIKLRVKCSSGTYMRSLAHGWGRQCGVGAVAVGIRRIRVLGWENF